MSRPADKSLRQSVEWRRERIVALCAKGTQVSALRGR